MNVALSSRRSGSKRPLYMQVVNKTPARIRSLLLLALSDAVALASAFLFADAIYWGNVRYADLGFLRSPHGTLILTILAPVYYGVAALSRAYSVQAIGKVRLSIWRSVQALLVSAAVIMFVAYFLKAGAEFSRAVFGVGLAMSMALLPLGRVLVARVIEKLLDGTPETVVVIRDGVPFERGGREVVVDADDLGFDPVTSDPFHYHAFANTVAHADRLLIACQPERFSLWSSVLKSMAVEGELITSEDDPIGVIGVGRFAGRRTMVVASGPLGLRDRFVKRVFDLALALPALLLLAPFLVGVAIAIRLESKGPVFFRQNRIGRDNKIFRMVKFRSMFVDQCDIDAARLTTRDDPRVTKVGDFIRRTSIDELPQLFNVLRGDMSIVGPRPHPLSAKAADLLYWDADPRYRHRHAIKPGLTGLAQVRGFRGNTERVEDLTNRLEADLEYVLNWSLARDVQLIFRTLLVLRHQNAF